MECMHPDESAGEGDTDNPPRADSRPLAASEWTVDQVCAWSQDEIALSDSCVDILRSQCIDGRALLELSPREIREQLGFPLGMEKRLIRERAGLHAAKKTDDATNGFTLSYTLPDDVHQDSCASCLKSNTAPLRQTFSWHDTVLPRVLQRPFLWIAFVISVLSVAFRIHREQRQDQEPSHFADDVLYMSKTVSLLHWAMIFYMSFYSGVGHKRWWANWECTQVAYGRINDLNVLVPAYMKDTPKLGSDVLRFVNAYHHIVYFDTHRHPVEYALTVCVQRCLLTKKEAEELMSQNGSKGMRVLIWASQTVAASGIDAHSAAQLNEMIVLLRRYMAYIWSWDDQMLPFAYTHAMNLFILVVLVWKSCLCGFDAPAVLGHDDRVLSARVALILGTNFMWTFAILVLREVSHIIADPFSSSMNGINSERYLDLHVAGTSKLVANNLGHPVDPSQDPGFASMATKAPDLWTFKERPLRDTKYLYSSRSVALRLKNPALAGL